MKFVVAPQGKHLGLLCFNLIDWIMPINERI